MMSQYHYIKEPNLPESDVRALLVGADYLDVLKFGFKKENIFALPVPACHLLPEPVMSHADLMLTYMGNGLIVSFVKKITIKCPEAIEKWFEHVEWIEAENKPERVYPKDVGMNVLILPNAVYAKKAATDPCILRAISKKQLINVKQGYTKCSVCVVTQNAAITADVGMARILQKQGCDVLLIEPGFIQLPGYDYGFIGGATVKISQNKLAFTGHLNAHPDRDRIIRFLEQHDVYPVFLSDRPVFDIGSMIPWLESI